MITINIDKAKAVAHDKRRAMRAEEFAPLDEQIAKQIPGIDAKKVEAERQKIREKYAAMQVSIDKASSPDQIKSALGI